MQEFIINLIEVTDMKKNKYIAPEIVTVKLSKQPLMTAVSGFEDQTSGQSMSPTNALSKGGMFWSEDDYDYEEE